MAVNLSKMAAIVVRSNPNYVEISMKCLKDVFGVDHFDFVTSTLSITFQGTDIGSDTGSYTDISLQIEMFAKEAGFININLAISYWTYCNVSG